MPTGAVTGQTTFGANTSGTTTQLDANFLLAYNALNSFQQPSNYLVDSGAANAYVVTKPANTILALAPGLPIQFKATNANTGSSTLNADGTGAKNILTPAGLALTAGAIPANGIVTVMYDGTQYQLLGVAAGQVPGTTTNDSAGAGSVGEIITGTVLIGAAVNVPNNTATNIVGITLTPGDWDVTGNVAFVPAIGTSATVNVAYISTTSATLPTIPNSGAFAGYKGPTVVNNFPIFQVGPIRVSLAANTSAFLQAYSTFTVSTQAAYGFIRGRRVR